MENLGKVVLVFTFYVLAFLAFGSLITVHGKRKEFSFSKTWLFGFFLYHVIFQIITIPVMFMQLSLSVLSRIWAIIAAIVIFWSGVRCWRIWIDAARVRISQMFKWDWALWIPVIVMGIHVILVSLIYVSFWDATYYIGQVSFAVYTDTINLIDPLTGDFLKVFDLKHCLATYHVNDAVICQLFRVHPLIETKTVMVAVIVILTNLLYYCLGSKLFQGQKRAVAVFMVLSLIVNICTYSAYTASGFLMYRTYEGKTITGNLSILMVVYLLLCLYNGEEQKELWLSFFLVSWGAVATASSAMFLVPAALAAGLIPYGIWKRSPLILGKMFIAMLPCLTVISCYLLGRIGWLEIAIKV